MTKKNKPVPSSEKSLPEDLKNEDSVEELGSDLLNRNKSEIVFGLVAPVGTDISVFEKILETELSSYEYELKIHKISKFLESAEGNKLSGIEIDKSTSFKRYKTLMDAGNSVRMNYGHRFLGDIGIFRIALSRETDGETPKSMPRTAHIIHSLKHVKEVEALREVYGDGFFLVGLYSNKDERVALLKRKKMSESEASELIEKDYNDSKSPDKSGQQTSKVYDLADVFLSLESDQQDKLRAQLRRFLELLFGHPFHTPTKDENAMFLSYSASLRSGSLARQIGAVVTNQYGDLVATGTNDAPRYGGGQYWTTDDPDARDFQRGVDANVEIRNSMLTELLDRLLSTTKLLSEDTLKELENLSPDEKLKFSRGIFKDTSLFTLTEYMRDVHAEMEALMSCARSGISVRGGILYCTTFPCHNCAKHIIDAGIERVVYVEAYPKSKAEELHSDALTIDRKEKNKLRFEPFIGIGPRRYIDLFSLSLGTGQSKTRKNDVTGKTIEWKPNDKFPRLQMKHVSYLEREVLITKSVKKHVRRD